MAKLYFRYGTVGSAKTLNLLAVAHNYRQQGKEVLLVKPEVDTRFGLGVIRTRAGLEMPADVIAPSCGPIPLPALDGVACILVDEAQFLTVDAVEQFRHITSSAVAPESPTGVPVICYGLRADFRRQSFPAAQRLFELADTLEEIKTVCTFCSKKAIFNLKFADGRPTLAGPSVELGCEEKYLPVCAACYRQQLSDCDPDPTLNNNARNLRS
jgi:thymidine kinase